MGISKECNAMHIFIADTLAVIPTIYSSYIKSFGAEKSKQTK